MLLAIPKGSLLNFNSFGISSLEKSQESIRIEKNPKKIILLLIILIYKLGTLTFAENQHEN